jgi:hypothetical protein
MYLWPLIKRGYQEIPVENFATSMGTGAVTTASTPHPFGTLTTEKHLQINKSSFFYGHNFTITTTSN